MNEDTVVKKKITVIADYSVSPVGVGISLSKHIALAVEAIKQVKGLRIQTHPMGTVLEAENLEDIFEAVKVTHQRLFEAGVKRMVSTLRIDDRRDKPRVMEDKIKALKKQ